MGKFSYPSPCPPGIGRVTGYPWVQHYKHIAEGRRAACVVRRGGRLSEGGGRGAAAVCVGAVVGRRSASGAPGGGRAKVCVGPQPSEGGGCGRAACGVGRADGGVRVRPAVRVWDWGGREEWGMRLGLASECWAGPKMNVELKYFVG
jgi:hypothetical protein